MTALDQNSLRVQFDEPIDQGLSATAFTIIESQQLPDSIQWSLDTMNEIVLSFKDNFITGDSMTLKVSGVRDTTGNLASTQFGRCIYFDFQPISPGDLVISEIMADPSPSKGLPEAEYVEVVNTSVHYFNLKGMTFSDASKTVVFDHFFPLGPGDKAIICDRSDSIDFHPFGRVFAVEDFPALNNGSDQVSIRIDSLTIDELEYFDTWHTSIESGGVSLERVDLKNDCMGARNWASSIDPLGGTPGKVNSMIPDLSTDAHVISGFVARRDSIVLKPNFNMDDAWSYSTSIEGTACEAAWIQHDSVLSLTSEQELERGKVITVNIQDIEDCAGNYKETLTWSTYIPDIGDVILNEILFDPRGDGADFLELMNTSDHDIELKGWALSRSTSLADAEHFDTVRIGSTQELAFTSDPLNILTEYPFSTSPTIRLQDIPSLPNSGGSIYLLDPEGEIHDSLHFHPDLHFALIRDPEGVSLERVDPYLPSAFSSNWHSASSSENYGTPGYENSQRVWLDVVHHDNLTLKSDYVSPDNDGYEDQLVIAYNFPEGGRSIYLDIFDESGVRVARPASNRLVGSNGILVWDGHTEGVDLARIGVYVALVRTVSPQGKRKNWRLPFVIVAPINQ